MTARWHIPSASKFDRGPIKGNAAHDYGTVTAPSADAAIRKVVKDYQITNPEELKRLAARPVA